MKRSGWVVGAVAALAVSLSACAESVAGPDELDVAGLEQAAGGDLESDRGPLRDELGLTDAQVAAIRAIMTELRATNAPLVEQLKAAEPRSEARRTIGQQIRANAEAARARVHALLTAEQRAMIEEHRANHPQRPHRRPGRG